MFFVLGSIISFTVLDVCITKLNVAGVYYLVHCVHNMLVIHDTIFADDMTRTLEIVLGFHLYHSLVYCFKMRMIDWLHHIFMMLIVVVVYSRPDTFGRIPVRTGLFFTTGLPGFCDYTALCLERNNILANPRYRTLSKHINVWIRGPGCTIAAYEIGRFAAFEMDVGRTYTYIAAFFIYVNGVYFAMAANDAAVLNKTKTD